MSKLKMNKSLRSNIVTFSLVIIPAIIMQIMVNQGSVSYLMQGLLIQFCYYSILAVSLNLTVGILGELSLGHAGFMCVGAFAGAFFSRCFESTIENSLLRIIIAILIGAAVAAIFGMLIGVAVLRLRGDYLAIVTLAFGEIIKNVINVLYVGKDSKGIHISLKDTASLKLESGGDVIIKGANGITSIPNDSTFILGVVLLVIALFVVLNMINSRSGRAVMAIRDNRIAAESVGIDITKYKLLAFTVSAMLAGAAGVLYAHNFANLQATPRSFGYNMSIMILVFVVLGGIGNIRGSVIAAVILTMLPEYLRFMKEYRMIIYAIVLIVLMIFNWNPKCIEWRKNHSIKGFIKKKFDKKQTKEAE